MSLRLLVLGLSMALLSMAACEDDSTAPPPEEGSITVDVYFGINVDNQPVQLSTSAQTYTNPAGTKYGIQNVRFIISDVKLHRDEGAPLLLKGVHYFDITDAATQVIHVEDLPHADFTGVSFTFGLDPSRNQRGKYPSIPAVMEWPAGMGAELGYHYMQVEGNFELTPGGATGGYTTHTGAHHSTGEADAHHYHFPVSASFTPAHVHENGRAEVDLNFNLNGWYMDHTPADGVDTQYDFAALPDQMIMEDDGAQTKLKTNGPGCFSATLTVHDPGHDH
jgi:hypothetical protein